ncbi:MAG: GntR family transcriptional regulator [Promicromonosporaceae bacterium]|nr:GntR family transcriptional regulator [Promicromonosporaceae bacterium]
MTYGQTLASLREHLGAILTGHPQITFAPEDRRAIAFYRDCITRFAVALSQAVIPGVGEPDMALAWAAQEGRIATHLGTDLGKIKMIAAPPPLPWQAQGNPAVEAWRQAAVWAVKEVEQELPAIDIDRWGLVRRASALGDVADLTRALTVLDSRYANMRGWRPLETQVPKLGQVARAASTWARTGPLDYSIDHTGHLPPAPADATPVQQAIHDLDIAAFHLREGKHQQPLLGEVVKTQTRIAAHAVALSRAQDIPELASRFGRRGAALQDLHSVVSATDDLDGIKTPAGGHCIEAMKTILATTAMSIEELAQLDRALTDVGAEVADMVEAGAADGTYVFMARRELRRVGGLIAKPVMRFAPLHVLDEFRTREGLQAEDITTAIGSLHAASLGQHTGPDTARDSFARLFDHMPRPAWNTARRATTGWTEISNELTTRIEAGQYAKTLPSLDALQAEFGVSDSTVALAVSDLVRQGLVESGKGRTLRIVSDRTIAVAPGQSLQQAIAANLGEKITSGQIVDHLPTRSELEATYGIGGHVLTGVLTLLRQQGLVEPPRRGGGSASLRIISTTPAITTGHPPVAKGPRWKELADDLASGISDGRHVGTLPTFAELCSEYGASKKTIRLAQQDLVDRGLIEVSQSRLPRIKHQTLAPSERVEPSSGGRLSHSVAAEIKARITSREFRGELPHQSDLVAHTGASKTTVAEAIRSLEREGLVQTRKHKPALILANHPALPEPESTFERRLAKSADLAYVRTTPRKSEPIIDDLARRIRAGEFGNTLPSSHELAPEYGASHATVVEAIQGLEREGLIQTRPRHRALITEAPNMALAPSMALRARLDAAYAISKRINAGEWANTPLPSTRELADQHGRSRQVILEALRELETRGRIQQLPDRRYTITTRKPPEPPDSHVGQANNHPVAAVLDGRYAPTRRRVDHVMHQLHQSLEADKPLPSRHDLMSHFDINAQTTAEVIDRIYDSHSLRIEADGRITSTQMTPAQRETRERDGQHSPNQSGPAPQGPTR